MSDTNNNIPDYKDTVFLPKTDFPMKAGLPQKEPKILAKWQEQDLYGKLREARKGAEKFILHDGPPYANGDMHIGHALNHILKDMVVRTQSLLGKDAPYIPGWDCHGLPIEWKVEEQYRKKKLNKDEVPVKEFRAECRAYAQQWVNVQREQLKRLGINGNWDKPYLTMDFDSEATIVTELLKFAESGQLYRGAKPVMWSPVEKTALAEAEVEYENITSTQIDVAFEITDSPIKELIGAYAVIWTTTPWTIPVNQALAYGPDVEYGLYEAANVDALAGKKFIIARALLSQFNDRLNIGNDAEVTLTEIINFKGSDLAGTVAKHPMADSFPDSDFFTKARPFLPGDFVTTDAGTGLVHMAPDHGEDDFDLCKAHGINPVFAVDADGVYREDWPWLPRGDERAGSVINNKFTAPDGPICSDLRDVGALLSARNDSSTSHSYPHSWRSKAKVIYRCTPQWFVPMDRVAAGKDKSLRETALQAIADTRWIPEKGRNRINSMVEGRPDWVLSRQRAWGVPITLFVDRKTGEYLVDKDVNARIIAAMREQGVDAWCDERAQEFLGDAYDAANYERIVDILDVWFDSGCTHAFVLESGKWPELVREDKSIPPANLYLEGSDQHRGWFQSSLLQSCGTRGRAPYQAVLTHGFTMDQKGMKMSKSLGNTISPLKIMDQTGADIIRLWALSVDFTEDHRIGDEILRGVGDTYRKLRNSFRYMLGGLSDFEESERVNVADMPELERYVLHLLAELDDKLRRAVNDYDFNTYTRLLSDFANEDLSAFFFDIRKDCLYCDAPSDPKRRAYRSAMDIIFHAMVRYAAPVLVFTAEEIWQSRFGENADSVHLQIWPEISNNWHDMALFDKWSEIRALREAVNEAIEPLRRDKIIRSSLQADVKLPLKDLKIDPVHFAEISIVAEVTDGHEISVSKTDSHKCGRCWRHLPDVAEDGALCGRCEDVIHG
ncbi:isoleucine--tRNA ligase [Sphingorhabdus lutea]|uniref:Isoleucine--tRNA ligase n=1 Tax=Sphingorhabdus lutea TaxID=1913578 RepID=A0A1L3J9M7_9SPHN|nr:isoleucine--tRNA ligase [Sphingorhabdus lutea]APG61793.1 isoleucine--tRNA ligase [Sphingorhabdus lutea]